jgi:hypothetical protein
MQPHHDPDEILVHVNNRDWEDMLRYATHARGDSWMPPFVSIETAKLRDLAFDLSPLELAAYFAVVGEYASAPLLYPGEATRGHRGPRRLTLARAKQCVTNALATRNQHASSALDSAVQAGLLTLSTVDGRSVDGLY